MVPRAVRCLATAATLLAGLDPARGAAAQGPTSMVDRVLLVVNDNSPLSRNIGEYYARRRGLPSKNICHLKSTSQEEITRDEYDRQIARPIGDFLRKEE